MSTRLKKVTAFIVLLCLIILMAVTTHAEEKTKETSISDFHVEKEYETVPLSQKSSGAKLISGNLLFDEGNWTLSLSESSPEEAELLYENAVTYKGNSYSVLMHITAASDNYAELIVSDKELKYSVNGDEIVQSDGNRIGNLAEEYAMHKPRYNYVLGGRDLSTESGRGLDCAHFVGRVYADCGQPELTSSGADANVNHLHDDLADKTVNDIIRDGPAKLSVMRRGDILIFYNNGSASHTAIYLGNGMIAHAMDENHGVCITDMRYNEETGIVGYSGKTLQRVLRPARTTTIKPDANVTVEVEYTVVDRNGNAVGGLDVGAMVKDGEEEIKASKLNAPESGNGYYAEGSTVYEKTDIASAEEKEVTTSLEAYVPVIKDYEEWTMDRLRKGDIMQGLSADNKEE